MKFIRFMALSIMLVLLLTSCGGNTNNNGEVSSEADTHTHTPIVLEAKEPTCKELGLTEGEKCSECGEILLAQVPVAAKAHDMVTQKDGGVYCSMLVPLDKPHTD